MMAVACEEEGTPTFDDGISERERNPSVFSATMPDRGVEVKAVSRQSTWPGKGSVSGANPPIRSNLDFRQTQRRVVRSVAFTDCTDQG